jgi:amino acid transporter
MQAASSPMQKIVKACRRFMGDGLLAYIIYSFMFMIFFNSATNSLQFGRMVLMSIEAHKTDNTTCIDRRNGTSANNQSDPDINQDLMRFLGVTVFTTICLTQFFSPAFGRKLNKLLAMVKIGFLIGVVIVALTALPSNIKFKDNVGNVVTRAQDWFEWHELPLQNSSKVSFAKALLAVLFSFEGWENATFVSLLTLIRQ